MRDGMTNAQAYYFGRAVGYVITMVHPLVNISKSWNMVYNQMLDEEEEFRNSDRFHYIFEDLYNNSRDDKWKEYFRGVKKGIVEVMSTRGLKEDGSHLGKMEKSKKIKNLVSVVQSFIEDKEKQKFVLARNEEFNTEKSKIYVTSIDIIYKMQKIRNATYMGGLAQDIGTKISKNNEVIAAIGKIIGQFGSFINNFGIKLGGVVEIPEEIVGIIPNTSEKSEIPVESEIPDTETPAIDIPIEEPKKSGNLDRIRSNMLKYKENVSDPEDKRREEEKNKIIERQDRKDISIKDFNLEEED